MSCATWEGTSQRGRAGGRRSGDVSRTQVPKEVQRPSETQFAAVSSPARSASMNMVAKGKKQLDNGNLQKAKGILQEAVTVDSTNGVAYYYLAKTRFQLKQHEEALGILDKAESLLGSSDEWTEAIGLLRSRIQDDYMTGERDNNMIPIINQPDTY